MPVEAQDAVKRQEAKDVDTRDRQDRWIHLTVAAAITVGVTVRVFTYAANPSLWIDDSRLALNIGARNYVALAAPLDYDQSAPLLFLWIEKLAAQLFGMNEHALRLIPLLVGLAIIPLAYDSAKRIGGARAGSVAAMLMALSYLLVQYSLQVKQYVVEAAVALALVNLGVRAVRAGMGSPEWRGLVVAGALAPWVAASSVFVLAAVGVVMAVRWARTGARAVAGLAACAIAWLGSFAVAQLLVYAGAIRNEYLYQYWGRAFVRPEFPGAIADSWRIVSELAGDLTPSVIGPALFGSPWSSDLILPAIVPLSLAIIGTRSLVRLGGMTLVGLYWGPLVVAIIASMLGFYPLHHRTLVFLVPLFHVVVALGASDPGSRLPAALRPLRTGSVVLLFLLALPRLVEFPGFTLEMQHIRPVVLQVLRDSKPGDVIYVGAGALPAWGFYSTDWHRPDWSALQLWARGGTSGGEAFENAPRRGYPVRNEPERLVRRTPRGVEVYGLFTGLQARRDYVPVNQPPDAGWAEHEANRIRRFATADVRIVATLTRGADRYLLAALKRNGFRVRLDRLADGVVLAEGTFGPAAAH